MFVKPSRRRTHLLLAGAVAVAGGAALLGAGVGSGSPSPSAEIQGAPLDTTTETVVTQLPAAKAAPAKPLPPPVPAVDLDKIARDGDRYVATLADGRKATLTLDPEMQKLAEKLLDESRAPRGAIVVMAPDGRILAIAGRRTTEPKGSLSGTFDWHLATEAWAPAASVFKLVTATALLDAGVQPDDKVCYHGGLRNVQDHNLKDDAKRDGLCNSLAYGVAHSQNAILGKLAYQKLEPKKLESAARNLGWASPMSFAGDLHASMGGDLLLGTTRDLEFAQAAAGFSNTKLSVLGGAVLAATFADDGEQPVPRLIESIDGTDFTGPAPHRAVPAETASAIAKMMAGTCDKGSARASFAGKKVAGKTGTLTREEPFYMEHSWFVGFAPQDKPAVIVSVLFGNAENWHLRGHEAARRLIDKALAPSRGKKHTPKS